MTIAPSRPILRYHGGKFRLADWIVSHFPPHRCYVEPFAGAASILMRKARVYSEIINDLDEEVVALFRVLRDPSSARELERLLRLTPYARAEFEQSYLPGPDPIECARRLICRSFMGHDSDGATRSTRTGFRNTAGMHGDRQTMGTTPARSWSHYPDAIAEFTARLQGVLIEQRPAVDVIRQFDTDSTLLYADPPYLWNTRGMNAGTKHGYRHEMTDDDHRELAGVLNACRGMVVLSGYSSALYDELYSGWRRVERKAMADGAAERVECLWLNPAAAKHLQKGLDL